MFLVWYGGARRTLCAFKEPRKTECGASQSLDFLAVRAAPFALLSSRRMYSVGVALKFGVRCKNCGKGIEIDDDYVPGIRGAELAANLYRPLSMPLEVDSAKNTSWQKTRTCENPDCRKTGTYGTHDLLLFEG